MSLLKKSQSKRTLLVIGSSAVVLLFGWGLYLTDARIQISEELRSSLMNRLVRVTPANLNLTQASLDSNGIIYVLGGSQRSLRSRFGTAAALYREGAAGKVLIMSRKGNTEFSPSLGRNLTNDEWAAGKLVDLGVKGNDIEIVSIPEHFWGTYHEAKAISDLTLQREYRYLILVSSPYHTRRAWDSFSKMLQSRNVSLYVYASDDNAKLSGLIIEYIKLLVYDDLLLPLSHDDGFVS